jgi:hypothetical protein
MEDEIEHTVTAGTAAFPDAIVNLPLAGKGSAGSTAGARLAPVPANPYAMSLRFRPRFIRPKRGHCP